MGYTSRIQVLTSGETMYTNIVYLFLVYAKIANILQMHNVGLLKLSLFIKHVTSLPLSLTWRFLIVAENPPILY